MTDQALSNAMKRIEELNERTREIMEEIERLHLEQETVYEEVDQLRRFVKIWHELADIPEPEMPERIVSKPEDQKRRRPKNPPREFVVEKSLEIIRERGEPISRTELFEELAKRGVVISGKDPEMVLSTMLWRTQDQIQRLKPFGYWPAGEPYEPMERIKAGTSERLDL